MQTDFDRHIEALIFSAPSPIGVEDIRAALEEGLQQEVTAELVLAGINSLFERYSGAEYAFEPAEMAGGYQFLTKGAYHNTIAVHLKLTTKKRLSQAAMETLALIAYRQPMTKSEMEQLRGVSCDYAIQKLLEKELVHISGRSEGPGKPLLYATSDKFMEYMGIRSMDDLPKLKDFKELENMVGESADLTDASIDAFTAPIEPDTTEMGLDQLDINDGGAHLPSNTPETASEAVDVAIDQLYSNDVAPEEATKTTEEVALEQLHINDGADESSTIDASIAEVAQPEPYTDTTLPESDFDIDDNTTGTDEV